MASGIAPYHAALSAKTRSTSTAEPLDTDILFCTAVFFFLQDTATTEIYTLSLHDALPIFFADPRAVLLWPSTDEDAGVAAPQRCWIDACPLQSLPCGLQQQPLLRFHGVGLTRSGTEEIGRAHV